VSFLLLNDGNTKNLEKKTILSISLKFDV
jgi:hypothetical protein